MDIHEWQKKIKKFAQEREWEQFHSPKNLAMALTVEASELLEIFQWMKEEDSFQIDDEVIRGRIEDEVADTLVYLLRISDILNIDLDAAVSQKMLKNGQKYPVDQCKGRADKYYDLKTK